MKTIERIKEIMNQKGIKQIELANALGLGKTTINAWFNNNTDPKTEQLEQIAITLNTSIEYLVTGQENNATYTREENDLIEKYRKANDTGRKKIMEYAEEMKNVYPAEVKKEMIS